MTFDEWEQGVPAAIRSDSVWRVKAYRLSLFLSDLAWYDAGVLLKDRRTLGIADQLFRATGKISSSICEGYSRRTGKARACFYDYALGSTREARDWYWKGRRALRPEVVTHRIDLCTEVIKLTLTMTARGAPDEPPSRPSGARPNRAGKSIQ